MRLLIAILCCLMLCGCAAIENNDILTSTPLPSPEAHPSSAFMEHDNNRKKDGRSLLGSVDPLCFFGNPEVSGMSIESLADFYNADLKRVDGLYQIETYVGGYDAQTVIVLKNDQLEQITTTFNALSEYDKIYSQLKAALGTPSHIYTYDDYYERVETDHYIARADGYGIPVWDFGGYKIEMSIYPPGNMVQMAHIAAYKGDYEDISYYGYEESGICCPHEHEEESRFDVNSIYLEPDLFKKDVYYVLKKYNAMPVYDTSEFYSKSKTGTDCYDTYMVKGLSIFGCEAIFEFSGCPGGKTSRAYYVIDVTQLETSRLIEICEKIDRYIVIGTNHGDNPGEIADELKRTINKMDYCIPLKEWQVSEGIDVRLYLIRTAEFSNDPGKCFLLLGM